MALRDSFRGFYPPTDPELDELWKTAAIVVDTSVLLNLYKYQVTACDETLKVLESVQPRLWMPHQVALEYHRRREAVIATQLAAFDKVRDVLGLTRIKARLDALQLRRFHSLISVDTVLDEIGPALDRFEAELTELEKRHIKPFGSDQIRDRLLTLVGNNIGAPLSADDLQQLYKEGEERYRQHVPPGYLDEKDKAKRPDFVYGGAMYRPMFGDLILWRQIVRYARDQKIKALMLISDDEKADWRQIHEHKGRRELLPHPELVSEIQRESGVELFFIYSSDAFLTVARERLGVTISDSTIPQVADVAEATRADEDPGWSDPNLSLIYITGEEGNRRDAVLLCGYCKLGDIALHFYEGDGTPKLREVLGVFHFWKCPALPEGKPVNVMVIGDKREPGLVTWLPARNR